AVEYLRQVLDEPWHGQKLLSCGPQKLRPQDLLHEFNEDLVFANYSYLSSGPSVPIPRTEVRGITIQQLSHLLDFVEERASSWCECVSVSPHYGQPLSFKDFNMYHSEYWVIGPATASPLSCSYVELVASEAASQRPLWYVSYVWQKPLHEFMACLRRHASLRELPEHTTYWVGALANNQHRLVDEVCNKPRKTSFCRALKLCTGLLLILDQDVVPLSRIWVCFEVSLAVEERNMSLAVEKRNKEKSGKHFLLDVAAMDRHGEAHLITDGLVGAEERMERELGFWVKGQREAKFPREMMRRATCLDIVEAMATKAEDKIRILNSLCRPRAKTRDLLDSSGLGSLSWRDPSSDAVGNAMREKLEETERLSSLANDLSFLLGVNKKKTDGVEKLVQDMDDELWNEQEDTVQKFLPKFALFEWSKDRVEQKVQEIRVLHSYHAGVSMAYLLHDFVHLAQQRSQEVDPTFLRLKEAFWLCKDKVGQNLYCPRDGKKGRALVDLLPPKHRQRQNYFMSWSWQYSVGQEASASLSQKISIGDKGIAEVTRSLCEVKVANAEAYDPRDEKKLKDTIRESVGFQEVNRHVKRAMVQWIGGIVKDNFEKLVNETGEECEVSEYKVRPQRKIFWPQQGEFQLQHIFGIAGPYGRAYGEFFKRVPKKGTFTCSSSTAEEALEYLRQVLGEPWHGNKLLSCGPQKLRPQDLLHEFNEDLVFANYSCLSSGPPVPIPRTEVRGITIKQLSHFLEFVEERASSWCECASVSPPYGQPLSFKDFNMYHSEYWVIGPATDSPLNCSYVELVASEAASQRPLWYVTHLWQQPLHEFMTCLRRHASLRELPEHTTYWDSALANNHNELEMCDPRKQGFCRALKLCTGLLLIFDQNADVMTRIWGCFDASLALEERTMSLVVEKRNKEKSGKHFLLDVAAMDRPGEAHLITDGLAGAEDMDEELWNEQDDTVQKFLPEFALFEWSKDRVEQKVQEIRVLHSYHAGVSMAYLLHDFVHLAQQRSQEVDPTFLRLKEAFWLCKDKVGQDLYCPRDGKLGRALVDLLPPKHRQRQNYFMSWTWQYSVGQVRNALQMWKAPMAAENVFFYMCFFVNNQFRLIVDGTPAGSDNLEEVFEENLRRCGQMVAILDGWHQPRYLRRVWTIYEQYVACSLKIDVAFVMPHEASASLSQRISLGDKGIAEVTRSLCEVNVANAEAYDPRDEKKVKDTIQESVGFQEVNRHVKSAMVQWIGGVVKDKFEKLVNETGEECEDTEDTFFV
ncbi:unnamed protein product, partial [Cladocopium goreaui]